MTALVAKYSEIYSFLLQNQRKQIIATMMCPNAHDSLRCRTGMLLSGTHFQFSTDRCPPTADEAYFNSSLFLSDPKHLKYLGTDALQNNGNGK